MKFFLKILFLVVFGFPLLLKIFNPFVVIYLWIFALLLLSSMTVFELPNYYNLNLNKAI